MNDKLLACPFCGSESIGTYHPGEWSLGIVCNKCHCKTAAYGSGGDQAYKAWNRRHPSSPDTWISVEDRLPEKSSIVLVYDKRTRRIKTMNFNHHGVWQELDSHDTYHIKDFTHWMPLPPNPEE